jgi:predicted amidohydrolase YtcJ
MTKFSLVFLSLLFCATFSFAQARDPIDSENKILFNARIFTANREHPFAEAIGISGKRIVAVGTLDDVKQKMSSAAVHIDLHGASLLPGFVDSHIHALEGGERLLRANADDSSMTTAALEAFVKTSIDNGKAMRGRFVVVSGLNITTWSRIPELQATFNGNAYAQQPILLHGSDGHTGWANNAMLKEAGITQAFIHSLSAEQKKFFGFTAQDEPNGFIADDGFDKFAGVIPEAPIDPMKIGLSAMGYTNRLGITAWLDPSSGSISDQKNEILDTYSLLASKHKLSAHVAATVVANANGDVQSQITTLKKWMAEYKAVRVLGFKIFADGVIEYPTQTAALSIPYTNSGSTGVLMVDPKKFNQFVIQADKSGLLVHVHAIGDEAITVALNGFEAARKSNGNSGIPHTITHLQVIKPGDFNRFAKLGVLASVQLLWALGDPTTIDIVKPYISPELYKYQYPARSLLHAGTVLCGASDWPVSSANPFIAIYEAETRMGRMGVLDSTQAVPRIEMLYAYTINAARAMRMENKIGSLAPGKSADLILVDRDVMNISAEACKNTKVIWTLFEGKPVYRAAETK